MSQVDRLIEQHILASESHLRHIDELMDQARETSVPLHPALQARLSEIDQMRQAAADDLAGLRMDTGSGDPVQVRSTLQTLGAELEKALAAVMETGRH
jgi:hypothetical protein